MKSMATLLSANQWKAIQVRPIAELQRSWLTHRCVVHHLHLCPRNLLTAGAHAFEFEMRHTIPVYLLALAIGELKCADIGPRSRVWAEPCQLDKSVRDRAALAMPFAVRTRAARAVLTAPVPRRAQFEFDEITEQYVATGERLFGPYRCVACGAKSLGPHSCAHGEQLGPL